MPTLLISLGISPAIVPEAFRLPGLYFDAVHVLTTNSTGVSIKFVTEWFSAKASNVKLTITCVDGFTDFRSEDDHFHFEEVLYRWWLEKAAGTLPHVCLAGGFKTMSSAMQKAAAVLGAAEVFHVLADSVYPREGGKPRPAATEAEIDDSLANGHVHWIKLGTESGWPQLKTAAASDYPLDTIREEGVVRWVAARDQRFREHLRAVVERSHNVAGSWDRLGQLPFPVLATWPAAALAWLEDPVDAQTDRTWMASLPKVELHCHLGGFASHGEALLDVRAAADFPDQLPPLVEPPLPADWPVPTTPIGLEPYMHMGDANGSTLLRDPGCLRRQCERLYDHLLEQNIAYAEIRCSPNNYTSPGRSAWDVLTEIRSAFQSKMTDVAEVAASVPLDSIVAARVSRDSPATTPVPAAASISPRSFIPFDREADYRQTWRDLPHRHQPGATVFATFRLADSLPRAALERWAEEREHFLEAHPKPWDEKTWTAYRRQFPERLEAWLDEAQGECLLRDERASSLVESALMHFDGTRYVLDVFAIMPNHVHVLFKPLAGHELSSILHSWKSFTAKEINRVFERRGQVWEHESFDHLLRSVAQMKKLREYVRANPEMAGLRDGCVVGMGSGLELVEAEAAEVEVEQPLATSSPASTLSTLSTLSTPSTPSTLSALSTLSTLSTLSALSTLSTLSAPSTLSALSAKGETVRTPDQCDLTLAQSLHTADGGSASAAVPPTASRRLGGTDESSRRLAPTVNLIVIATRKDGGDRSDISRHLALAITAADQWRDGCRVVGVDLAGWEKPETRAALFATDFEPVHRVGLAVTVHAGENDDAEGIWQAVFKLNARRLGHALHLFGAPDLLRAVADRGIGIEMCPLANFQIKGFALLPARGDGNRFPTYPLKPYLDAGLRVTVNTDNIGISAGSLTDNFLLAAQMCPDLTRMDILRLLAHAVSVSFLSPEERNRLSSRIEASLDS